jgi:hypothetical protein
MEFPVNIKSAYGRVLRYPANEQQARGWERITGKKTVTDDDLRGLELLGFNVVESLAVEGDQL